jgi:hypothetical protein
MRATLQIEKVLGSEVFVRLITTGEPTKLRRSSGSAVPVALDRVPARVLVWVRRPSDSLQALPCLRFARAREGATTLMVLNN